jgi:hypothetical protein
MNGALRQVLEWQRVLEFWSRGFGGGVGCNLWWEVSGGHLVVNGDLLVGGMAWPGLEFPSLGKDKEGPEVFCARGTCSRVSIWRGRGSVGFYLEDPGGTAQTEVQW